MDSFDRHAAALTGVGGKGHRRFTVKHQAVHGAGEYFFRTTK